MGVFFSLFYAGLIRVGTWPGRTLMTASLVSLPREDRASLCILLHLAKHSPELSDGEGGMVSLVSSGGGALWNCIEQTLKASQG